MQKSVEIIAEAGLNHKGRLHLAYDMITAACIADADIIKFQTYTPEAIVHKQDPNYQLLKDLAFGRENFKRIAKFAEDCEIEFLSTPGDVDSLKFLVEELGVKRIKIGSDDLTYKPLMEAAAATNLPLIISTGMASMKEISDAIRIIHPTRSCTLLHCVSLYPCPIELANLRAINFLRWFARPVGYSDHVPGFLATLGAVALGATMIEKHFMLNGHYDCIDRPVSVNEYELQEMIKEIRVIEQMLGSGDKTPSEAEQKNIAIFRKQEDGLRQCVP